ncbi:heterokaryon incompatibility protein-domain-containing protein, partial [Lophiotrema nucula]
MARSRLAECLSSHHHEPAKDPYFTPSRLLQVASSGDKVTIRLIEPQQPQPYLVLSYCWGGDQEQKLMTKNLELKKRNIIYDDLPRTITDAIKVTTKLGYEYIWIDSMCIVQDDDDDKMREIPMMSQIYSQADMTLAIACAATVTEGFLHHRRDTTVYGESYRLRFQCPDGQIGTVTAFNDPNNRVMKSCPLSERGWTLQERLLSTRMLEFSIKQARFICPNSEGRADCVDGWNILPTELYADDNIPVMISGHTFQLQDMWRAIVENFTTKRQLSVLADRPFAIMGIAKGIGNTVEDAYIAGHWLSTLPLDLLWQGSHPPIILASRQRQPTWAWTSIDARID